MARTSRQLVLLLSVTATMSACGLTAPTIPPTPTRTVATAVSDPQPLCPRGSRYVIELADINQPISECAMYFYIGFIEWGSPEKTLQVVIQRAQPIPVENGYPSPVDQVLPSLYRWVVRGTNGNLERAWFSGFIRGRDGLYHTVVTQSQDEWLASYLEIFFEDVNDDGAREDVTYEVPLAQFLPTNAP